MNDELERLKRFRATEAPPTRAATQSAREQLIKLIEASASTASRRHRASWRRRARRPAAALALVGLAALVALVVGTGSTSPPAAVAAVLRRLANTAAIQSPVTPPPAGHYLHVSSLQAGQTVQVGSPGHPGCTVLVPEQRQIWISASGSGRILDVPGSLSFPSAREKRACEKWHSAVLRDAAAIQDTWYAPGCYDLGDASRLQGSLQNPKALLHQMAQIDGGPIGPAGDFLRVGSFLRESDASPQLRAAIYRAAATIPGLRLLGSVTDRLGRHGIGMTLTSDGSTSELIFNPRDGSMLASQTTNSAGQLIGWGVYHPNQIVNRIPGHPPVRLTPPCGRSGVSYGRPGPSGTTIFTGRPQPK